MRFRVSFVAAVVGVAALVSACSGGSSSGSPAAAPGPHTLKIQVVAPPHGTQGCYGAVVHRGTHLVMTNESGKVIAAGNFAMTPGGGPCDFSLTLPQVPDADAYTLKAANGAKLYTVRKAAATKAKWALTLVAKGNTLKPL